MPIFLVSLLKSYSLALRDRTLKPCSQVGALTLLSEARPNGRCGASNSPHRKNTRATRVICTRLDMDGPRVGTGVLDRHAHEPHGRFNFRELTQRLIEQSKSRDWRGLVHALRCP